MIHQIQSTGKFRETFEYLQDTGVALLQAIANAQPTRTAKEVIITLDSMQDGFGGWLAGKPQVIVKPVGDLIQLRDENRTLFNCIMEIVQHDLGFYRSEKTSFRFRWEELPVDVRKLVGGLFVDLFNVLLGDGDFRKNRLGEVSKFGKKEMVKAFLDEHPKKKLVCPACDGRNTQVVPSVARAHDDLDHYLPKNKYPLLAVSPDNVVPVCLPCNLCFKGEHDPLEGLTQGGLKYIFLPYYNPALSEISLEFELKATDIYPNLTAAVKTGLDVISDDRIKRLNDTLHLVERWRTDISTLDKQLNDLVISWADYSSQREWTVDFLKNKLQKFLEATVLPHVGEIPYFFIYSCFIKWAIRDYVPILLDRINRLPDPT